jgi:hypothetical protein
MAIIDDRWHSEFVGVLKTLAGAPTGPFLDRINSKRESGKQL